MDKKLRRNVLQVCAYLVSYLPKDAVCDIDDVILVCRVLNITKDEDAVYDAVSDSKFSTFINSRGDK